MMVIYLESLEGVLRDHRALLEIVERACEKWGVGSPIGERQLKIASDNLALVRGLLNGGYSEIDLPPI